jgi:hypothetical protein
MPIRLILASRLSGGLARDVAVFDRSLFRKVSTFLVQFCLFLTSLESDGL